MVFKDARFNGWSIGGIFAIDKLLIPNARRDNFEKNPAYFALLEHLMTLAAGITRDIRAASLKRNAPLSNAINQLHETAQQATSAMDKGVSGAQKGLFQAVTLKVEACFAEVPAYSAAPVMDSRAVVIRTRDLEIELLGSHEAEVAEGFAPGRDHDHLQGGGGLRILQ